MNIVIPTSLIAAALAGFFLYVSPQYAELNNDLSTRDEYISAIAKIGEVSDKYDEARKWKNELKLSEKTRLSEILPDTFDNVQFNLDIDRLATKNGISVGAVDVLAKGTKATKGYEVYVVSFSFTAPYSGNAQVFMSDLEQSLTLFDVESIDISLTNENNLLYSLLLNTYAMK